MIKLSNLSKIVVLSSRFKNTLNALVFLVFPMFFSSAASAEISGVFWIQNLGTADNLRIGSLETNDSVTTVPSSYTGGWTQWEFVPSGNYYHIRSRITGEHLRPRDASDYSEIYMVPGDWTGEWTQWSLETFGDASFRIVNRKTGKFLRPSSNNAENYPVTQLAPTSKSGSWTAWKLISTSPATPIGDTAYSGGAGTVAGALPTNCETPEGFTRVNSLAAMKTAMNKNNVKVALAPGTYSLDTGDSDLFTSQALPNNKTASTLMSVNGQNSQYDFRCTKINFDTELWSEFGNVEVIQLRTVGNNNVISNLNIEDIGDASPRGGALNVIMDGRDNTLQGSVITARGSQPYGLGDAYGKGGGPVLSHQKHSSVLIRGLRNTFKQSTVFNYAYGHSVFTQGAEDTLIDGIYVQGELRSTANMLAANTRRFAAADARAASVNFVTVWGYRLPTGYWMSLQEAGIRAYNGGNTVIDGVEYARGTDTVSVVNSVIRNVRTGVGLHQASGTTYVENTTTLGCESGFGVASGGEIVGSYADADIGPVLVLGNSGTTVDITILPTNGSRNGSGELAYIGGSNHDITLRSNNDTVNQNLKVVLSGDNNSIRHQDGGKLEYQDNVSLLNTEVNNLTNFPMLINNLAEGNTGQSNGRITGNTSQNSVRQN